MDGEVDRFVISVRALPAGQWVHFHCRAGKGRTTTVLALYDMLRNAGRVSLDDIVNRQSLLIGDYNLLQLEEQSGWKAPLAADRANFVRAFYDYARANPNGSPQLWSEWLRAQEAAGANAPSQK
jgi:protein-tyrosine phosphatase